MAVYSDNAEASSVSSWDATQITHATHARHEAVLTVLRAAGLVRQEPPLLQPAGLFLDLAGEDIRQKLCCLASDGTGDDLCLRPEYTIPLGRAFVAAGALAQPAQWCAFGPVFRQQEGAGPAPFIQAGIESFGRMDAEAAEVSLLALALETARAAAGSSVALEVRIGDTGLFARLLEVLDLPPFWQRRLRRLYRQGQALQAFAPAPENGAQESVGPSGLAAALAKITPDEGQNLVQDLLALAGITPTGGRTPADIASRFLEQASAGESLGPDARQRRILERFFAIEADPDSASAQLHQLARDEGLDLAAALHRFDTRIHFMAAQGLDLASMVYAARFARQLDYYTGFIFEAHLVTGAKRVPVVAGGRYDGLLQRLGATQAVPAIGAAIWCDPLFALSGLQEYQ